MKTFQKVHHTPTMYLLAYSTLTSLAGIGLALTVLQQERYPGIYAFALSWIIMAFGSAMTSKVFRRLDPMQFRLKVWEREGKVYEWLGVGVFRWVLLRTPLGWLNPHIHLKSRRTDLDSFLRELNISEGVHWVAAGITVGVAGVYLLTGHTAITIWLLLVNIPLNFYPVILQRWNRGRVQRMQSRLTAHSNPGLPGGGK